MEFEVVTDKITLSRIVRRSRSLSMILRSDYILGGDLRFLVEGNGERKKVRDMLEGIQEELQDFFDK